MSDVIKSDRIIGRSTASISNILIEVYRYEVYKI